MSTPTEEHGDLLMRNLWKHQTDCIFGISYSSGLLVFSECSSFSVDVHAFVHAVPSTKPVEKADAEAKNSVMKSLLLTYVWALQVTVVSRYQERNSQNSFFCDQTSAFLFLGAFTNGNIVGCYLRVAYL